LAYITAALVGNILFLISFELRNFVILGENYKFNLNESDIYFAQIVVISAILMIPYSIAYVSILYFTGIRNPIAYSIGGMIGPMITIMYPYQYFVTRKIDTLISLSELVVYVTFLPGFCAGYVFWFIGIKRRNQDARIGQ